MTDETLDGTFSQVSVTKDTQVLTEQQSRPVSGSKPTVKRKTFQSAISSLTGFILGFLLGGTEFPLETYPLGCALVASLSHNVIAAMLGVIARIIYLSVSGKDLLLPLICCVSLLVCRIILNVVVFGKGHLLRVNRLPDSISMKMLLCALFVFGISFVDVVYNGVTPYGVLRAAMVAIVAVTFTLLFTFCFDDLFTTTEPSPPALATI